MTVSTGRGYFASSYIWKQLKIQGPVIIYGGAIIMDTRTDQPIHTTAIPPELVRELLERANELGIHAHIYQGDWVIWEKPSLFGEKYCERLGLPHRADRRSAAGRGPMCRRFCSLGRMPRQRP